MAYSKAAVENRYIVKSLVHASKVLGAFRSMGEVLALRDVVERTGLKKGMCFRLLYTLHECGIVEKKGGNEYRRLVSFPPRQRYRIGFAKMDRSSSFSQQVLEGLEHACQRERIELIVVDNRCDPDVASRNADHLVKEGVDLAVEFQVFEAAAPIVASKFQSVGIPVIAVDCPHPGAMYFGADNYMAGLLGGRCLGHYAKEHWHGMVDSILIIQVPSAGRLVLTRTEGMVAGIWEVLPSSRKCACLRIDSDGRFKRTLELVRNHLRTDRAKRILIGAANDPEALAALRAFQEAGRGDDCVVVGQGAEPEARAEMRQPETRLIGSVAFFPERYGESIVRLALDILSGRALQSVTFTKHKLITPQNVDHLYPNDSLVFRMAQEYS